MKKVTALIPTYNEEENLLDCLESVKWADEILIVDSFSTDRTVEIAKSYNARILQREYQSHASQRNWAIPQATHEWILLVDADERADDRLRESIQRQLSTTPSNVLFSIKRRNFFFGNEIKQGGWGHDWIVRFFHRDHGHFEEYGYHGEILVQQKPGRLHGNLDHLAYRSMDDYFRKFHLYTDRGAQLLFQKNRRASWIDLTLRPCWRFFYSYIIRLGFLDGIPGLLVCVLSAFYSFTKFFKLWHLQSSRNP